jgi:hypothetical protein
MAFFTNHTNKHGALRLDDFVLDGAVNIPAQPWLEILRLYSSTEIRCELSRVHEAHNLESPIDSMLGGLAAGYSDFQALQAMDGRKLVKNIFIDGAEYAPRHPYEYPPSDWYISLQRVGLKSSDFFHRRNRMRAGHVSYPSPADVWAEISRRVRIFKPIVEFPLSPVTRETFMRALAVRSYVASQFRPSTAKALYELFKARDVLDPSSGWGDRFAGFSAANTTESYVSTDPNLNLHEGYWQQGRVYRTGKAYDFMPVPFEDADLGGKTFDFIFTSPPYFHTELYSEHAGQSSSRYAALEAWLELFLFRVMDKCCAALRPGGIMAINIADLNTALNTGLSVCDAMNDYVSGVRGMRYMGSVGMQIARRPSNKAKQARVVEPIWVWQKNGTTTIDELVRSYKA